MFYESFVMNTDDEDVNLSQCTVKPF